jgi:hypothetical protein
MTTSYKMPPSNPDVRIMSDMDIADFTYEVTHDIIEQTPIEQRENSRLIVLHRD